jgi:hypothetical protein
MSGSRKRTPRGESEPGTPEPVRDEEPTKGVRTRVLTGGGDEDNTAELLLDPGGVEWAEIDGIAEFEGSAGTPPPDAAGTVVMPTGGASDAVAADVQRAIDVGVSMATTMIEPLPPGQGAALVVDDGSPPIPVTKSVTVIGRSKEFADVVVANDDQVSRHHAALIFGRGEFYLEDLASSNGTFVGQKRIKRVKLSPGEPIRIGRRTLHLRLRK